MAEYIDREAVHEAIEKAPTGYWGSEGHVVYADDAHKQIDDIPAADVRPAVHGQWIGTADGYADGQLVYDTWECSCCGYDADGAEEKPAWNFCPMCGADMRRKGEG